MAPMLWPKNASGASVSEAQASAIGAASPATEPISGSRNRSSRPG